MNPDEESMLSNIPETTLMDQHSGEDVSAVSDVDGSFTSFDDIRNSDQRWALEHLGSHSRSSSTPEILPGSKEFLEKTSAILSEYTEVARVRGQEFAKESQLKVSTCAAGTQENVTESIKEFFSPEQQQVRAELSRKLVAAIRSGLHSCHENVDRLLLHFFEQPIQEVEVRQPMDRSGSISLTDEITIDSFLRKRDQDDLDGGLITGGSASEPPNVFVQPRRTRLGSKKIRVVKKQRRSLQKKANDTDESKPSFADPPDILTVPTTESHADSLRRFKEELYSAEETQKAREALQTEEFQETEGVEEEEGPKEVLAESTDTNRTHVQEEDEEIPDDEAADEAIAKAPEGGPDQIESRNGSETLTSSSMEELDRLLRTDIEKLDRLSTKEHDARLINQSGSDILKINTSSSTPLRGNLRSRKELADQGDPAEISITGTTLSTAGVPTGKEVSTPVPRANAADEDVIDLTMFDEEKF